MAKAKTNPVDELPVLRKGYRIELNRKYFSRHNGREPPFTRGAAYKILEVVDNVKKYERTPYTSSNYKRQAVIIRNDEGGLNRLDSSFLAKPGWWASHKDEPDDSHPCCAAASPAAPSQGDGPQMMQFIELVEGDDTGEAHDSRKRKSPEDGSFPWNVRMHREKRGMTQAELARRMKRASSYISAVENTARKYTVETVESFADGLGLDGDDRLEFFRSAGYTSEEHNMPEPGPAEEVPDALEGVPQGDGETFGQVLRRYREAACLQQKELAERLGIRSRTYISMLESDRSRKYRGSSIRKLADALGLEGEDREVFYAAGGYRAEKEAPLNGGFNTVLKNHRSRVMSQDELSEVIGLSRSYIAHLETGDKRPSLKATIRIADALRLAGSEREEFFLLAGYGSMNQVNPEPEASEGTETIQDDL